MRNSLGGHHRRWLGPVLAAGLPAVILLAAYASIGVFPFGEKSLLLVDMNNEYIDYFAHLHRTVRGDGSFLRSWQMGMGLNMTGLIAFYMSSGLNLLVLLLPASMLTESVLLVTLVKVSLCGVLFRLYARYIFGSKLHETVLLAASTAYALCGYSVAYSSNIMWLDGVAFLPLVCMGVERLLRENRSLLLIGSLVYVFLSSYYIGYMIGGFSLLYFIAMYFSKENDLRKFGNRLLRFLLSAALAAGCCAFLLLPAYLELRDGQSGLWQIPLRWRMSLSLTDFGSKLLPGSFDNLTNAALPHIYTTIAGLLGAAIFYTGKGATRRQKLVMGGLLSLLLVSMSCDALNLAWHAFETPTWFPARYSFVFSFLLLVLALWGAAGLEYTSTGAIWGGAGMLLVLFIEVGIRRYPATGLDSVFIGIGLAVCYAIIALCLCGRNCARFGSLAMALALPVLVCAELTYNTWDTVQAMDEKFGYKTRASYNDFHRQFAPGVDWVSHNQEAVSRMEIAQYRNANGGMALGYRGMAHYSTTTDQRLNTLLRSLGYNTGTINEVCFAPNTPVTNGLLGIRYLLSTGPVGAGYELVSAQGDVDIYQNNLAFPLAYYAKGSGADANLLANDPFAFQNQWIASLYGDDAPVFLPLEIVEESADNLERQQDGNKLIYRRINPSAPGSVEFALRNPTGYPAYAYLPVANRKFATATAYVDGEKVQRELGYRNNSVIALGTGEIVRLRLDITSDTAQLRALYFYALDLDQAKTAARQANANALEFSRFDDTRVAGTVTAPEDGMLVTSFPYDRGWTVLVDGQKTDLQLFAGAFLAVDLKSGTHTVEMRYCPPGFVAGYMISSATVTGWCIIAWLRWRNDKQSRIDK